MNYHNLYIGESSKSLRIEPGIKGSVAWESPSNIALIKYWGKGENQLPMNPSLSISLSASISHTRITFRYQPKQHGSGLTYFFHNQPAVEFENRLREYFERITPYLPFLHHMELEIRSENSFPHSSGIASSASAFSSVALCLLDMEMQVTGLTRPAKDFLRKASFLARLGSGSASRSVYGGFVLWGRTKGIAPSSDELAVSLNNSIHERFSNLHDVILLVDPHRKKIPSSKGHAMMMDNPYAKTRFTQAKQNLEQLIEVLKTTEMHQFFDLVEYEALSLHAMMMTSFPGYFLMKPATLAILEKIRQFRVESDVPVGFTMDAGANVHVLFPEDSKNNVMSFINAELKNYCHEQKYITDQSGQGPKRVQQE